MEKKVTKMLLVCEFDTFRQGISRDMPVEKAVETVNNQMYIPAMIQ